MFIQTVRVKVKPCAGNPAGVVVMNESDYLANKDAYELYDPEKAKAEEAAKALEEKAEAEKAEADRLEKERLEKEKADQEEKPQDESPRRGKR